MKRTRKSAAAAIVVAVAAAGLTMAPAAADPSTPVEVHATEPTVHDVEGAEHDTFTIPAIPGVEYHLDGSPVEPGTYPVPHPDPIVHNVDTLLNFTARALDGFILQNEWTETYFSAEVSPLTVADWPVAPTVDDQPGTDEDTITIPAVTGLDYRAFIVLGGEGSVELEPGTHKVADLFTLTGEPVLLVAEVWPASGYELPTYEMEDTSWSIAFDGAVWVEPGGPEGPDGDVDPVVITDDTEPEAFDAPGVDDDKLLIPEVEGVEYRIIVFDGLDGGGIPDDNVTVDSGEVLVHQYASWPTEDSYVINVQVVTDDGYEFADGSNSAAHRFTFSTSDIAPSPSPAPAPSPAPKPAPAVHAVPGDSGSSTSQVNDGGIGGSGREFHLANGFTGKADHIFGYGNAGGRFYVGDWDGDGKDTLAYRIGSTFYIRNANSAGRAHTVIHYGRPGDRVYVGDWDGDGRDTFAVRRGRTYHVKNSLTGGPADQIIHYGREGDTVLVGDWDGDGEDTFAVRRGNAYHVKNSMAGGNADKVAHYGRPGDDVYVGDWDGNGSDSFAVRRDRTYFIKNAIAGGNADRVLVYGRSSDTTLVGDWNGDGKDTLGIRR